MGKMKNLAENEKSVIAYLYQIKNLSPGIIADALGHHRNTINKYKNYTPGLTKGITKAPTEEKKEDRQEIVKKVDLVLSDSKKDQRNASLFNF